MTNLLYIATAMGLYIATQVNGQWQVTHHTLTDHALTSVGVSADAIVAGGRDNAWRSADNGRTWQPLGQGQGLTIRHIRWIEALSAPSPVFVLGTEPAGVFISRDGGKTWRPGANVMELRDRYNWYLPYSPEAGCVRGFALENAGRKGSRIYAAVEVGGVLVSEDLGQSWRMAGGSDGRPELNRPLGDKIHPDVHAVTVHPGKRQVVTAPTGGGLYRSMDGGATWRRIHDGYMRAVWVDPADHRRMVAGPADGVSRNGRIEVTFDGGANWLPAARALQPPWPRHMVDRFVQVGDNILALLSNGELWSGHEDRLDWSRVLPQIPDIKAVAGGQG